MRSRIVILGRDVALRARLARILNGGGYRVEIAENAQHARRLGSEGASLAIFAASRLDPVEKGLLSQLQSELDGVLLVATPDVGRELGSESIDISDEAGLLARVAAALAPDAMVEVAEPALRFDGFLLDLAGRSLLDPSGREVPLTAGEFSLLRVFVERAGRVLSRDQLLQWIAGRDAEAYERSIDMQIVRLRRKIEAEPKRPKLIVTVPGSGYKFTPKATPATTQASPAEPTRGEIEPEISASGEVAPPRPEPPRLSLVVLPFANIGGGPEQEDFVDGVTETLTTDLSRIRGAFVIGRNTAFTYKGKAVDLKQIGRELNVRYVLEGSVQRGGNRMRVNVQLIDAETGKHLWAERFDKSIADLFDMQDEIVARLANPLNAQLVAAEARRAEHVPTPDSMDLYFRGQAWLNRGLSAVNVAQARDFFERALAEDPENMDAVMGLATVEGYSGALFFAADPAAAFRAAEARATEVLSVLPDHPRAHLTLGFIYIFTRRAAAGIAECEHALALDPSLAHAHAAFGWGKIFVGRAEDTEAHIAEALRLSPRDTTAFAWMNWVAFSKGHVGDYEQAIAWGRRSIEANRNYQPAYFWLAAALARLGRLEEARSAVSASHALNPTFSVSRGRALWTSISDNPKYLAGLEPLLEGLRLAGVPEA